jgi:predicted ABC-class ATPase
MQGSEPAGTKIPVRTAEALKSAFAKINGRSYKAYKALQGVYHFPGFRLVFDHIQSDPYASPSHLRVQVPAEVAEIPRELYRDRIRRIALQDFLIRGFAQAVQECTTTSRGRIIGGGVSIDCGGQEVLERSAMKVVQGAVEARFVYGLPGDGRTVAGGEAARLLCEELPRAVHRSLVYQNLARNELKQFIEVVEDQCYLRRGLEAAGLVAFVGDGSILPRKSGVEDTPLDAKMAIPFTSPESLRVTLEAPNAGQVTGMGIPPGVTLIVGGGFHGKSTLLNALERSVYNHIPGDGRDQVVITQCAVKIRAEDGRYVNNADISDFIGNLPGDIDTHHFSSNNASGSTSQATNIVEALEVGATCLLMDEDTCATNFMIRDERMQTLVAKDKEPIIPFIDRVRGLHRNWGVSTVLVMGGAGDYLEVADTVIMFDEYYALDRTDDARRVAAEIQTGRVDEGVEPITKIQRRTPYSRSIDPSKGRRSVRIATRSKERMQFGGVEIDLSALSQLVDISQTRAIGEILVLLKNRLTDKEQGLVELLDQILRDLEREGLDIVVGRPVGYLALPRRFEIAAALNRLRGVKMKQLEGRKRTT